ncbi:MAG: hypothetical protein AAF198_11845 [Pseudomonadota bacterium]
MNNDPSYNIEEGMKCGNLFAHIILQAFNDAISPQAFQGGDARLIAQTEAIKFLTASRGEWRAHRNWICSQIGVDGDSLTDHMRDLLLGVTDIPVFVKAGENTPGVARFKQERIDEARALYREMMEPPPLPKPKRARPKPVPTKPKDPPPGRNGSPFIPANASLLDEWETNITA